MTSMARRHPRSASQRLARIDLVLAPGRAAGARLRAAALGLCLLAAAAGAGWWAGLQGAGSAALAAAGAAVAPAGPATPGGDDALAPRLEQARVALQVAESRGHELERQIDALNQRLHQCQEELMFFRKASGKRAP